jgi:hypothetical protein
MLDDTRIYFVADDDVDFLKKMESSVIETMQMNALRTLLRLLSTLEKLHQQLNV